MKRITTLLIILLAVSFSLADTIKIQYRPTITGVITAKQNNTFYISWADSCLAVPDFRLISVTDSTGVEQIHEYRLCDDFGAVPSEYTNYQVIDVKLPRIATVGDVKRERQWRTIVPAKKQEIPDVQHKPVAKVQRRLYLLPVSVLALVAAEYYYSQGQDYHDAGADDKSNASYRRSILCLSAGIVNTVLACKRVDVYAYPQSVGVKVHF